MAFNLAANADTLLSSLSSSDNTGPSNSSSSASSLATATANVMPYSLSSCTTDRAIGERHERRKPPPWSRVRSCLAWSPSTRSSQQWCRRVATRARRQTRPARLTSTTNVNSGPTKRGDQAQIETAPDVGDTSRRDNQTTDAAPTPDSPKSRRRSNTRLRSTNQLVAREKVEQRIVADVRRNATEFEQMSARAIGGETADEQKMSGKTNRDDACLSAFCAISAATSDIVVGNEAAHTAPRSCCGKTPRVCRQTRNASKSIPMFSRRSRRRRRVAVHYKCDKASVWKRARKRQTHEPSKASRFAF